MMLKGRRLTICERPQKLMLKDIKEYSVSTQFLDKTNKHCIRKAIYASWQSALPAQFRKLEHC